MNDVLVIYASTYGHAETIARRIAATVSESGAHAAAQDARFTTAADLLQPRAVIVVASVHFGRHPRSVTRFVKQNRVRLAERHAAFISVSGDAIDDATRPRAEQYAREFSRITGWVPSATLIAAGAVSFTKYNWLLRSFMKRSLAAKGRRLDSSRDHDYTDWDAVTRFVTTLLSGEHVKVA